MDIAKIRKKARERAQEETPEKAPETPPAGQEETPEKVPETPPAGQEETPEKAPVTPPVGQEETPEKAPVTPPVGQEEKGKALSAAAPAEQEKEEAGGTAGAVLELLTFRLSNEEFAFKVSEVEEIVRHQSITRVPSLPDYVLGITSLRGKIIPVIDLKKRLALSDTAAEGGAAVAGRAEKEDGKKKILIIAGPKGLVGVTIDKVMGVVSLPQENLLEPPAHLTEEELKCISGVVILEKRFISAIRAEDALDIEGG